MSALSSKDKDSSSLSHTPAPAHHQHYETKASRRRKVVLRVSLVATLVFAAGGCATMSYSLLKDSEDEVGRQTYESVAAAALSNAQSTTRRKLQGSEVMATLLSHILPNETDWPLIDVPGYIPMASKVAELSSSNTQALMVFLDPDQVAAFEPHMMQVYKDQGRPEGTGYSDFGFGIWKSDDEGSPQYEDGRVHDTTGTNDWGGIYPILAPLTMHNVPGAGSLLYNVYSDADRGIHLESMKDCVQRFSREQQSNSNINTTTDASSSSMSPAATSPQCPVITDMLELKIRPGPAGLLFQPVFPAQNKTHLVGFATTSIHWQSVLEAVVPDYVSGLTCVVATATSSYTFEIQQGIPELVGDGDLHDTTYTDLGRSVVLNEIPTGSITSAVYYLTVYPTGTFSQCSCHPLLP